MQPKMLLDPLVSSKKSRRIGKLIRSQKDMRRIIESFNKSLKGTQCLQQQQRDEFGKTIKLVNFAYQRWSFACRMYGVFLKNFTILQQFLMREKTPLKRPQGLILRTVEELYTILCKVDETVTYCQNDDIISASPLSIFSCIQEVRCAYCDLKS